MRKRINLLYSERKASSYIKLPFSKKSILLNAISLVAVIGIIVTLYQFTVVKVYTKKLSQMRRNFETIKNNFDASKTKLERIKKEKEELRQDKARLDEKIAALKDMEEGTLNLSKYLVGIIKLVPEDLWVKNIVLDSRSMKIKGGTLKLQSISDFMIRLDKSKIFKDTTFNFTERAQGEKSKEKTIDFEIVTRLVM